MVHNPLALRERGTIINPLNLEGETQKRKDVQRILRVFCLAVGVIW